jgi:hypothetical protein
MGLDIGGATATQIIKTVQEIYFPSVFGLVARNYTITTTLNQQILD